MLKARLVAFLLRFLFVLAFSGQLFQAVVLLATLPVFTTLAAVSSRCVKSLSLAVVRSYSGTRLTISVVSAGGGASVLA